MQDTGVAGLGAIRDPDAPSPANVISLKITLDPGRPPVSLAQAPEPPGDLEVIDPKVHSPCVCHRTHSG